MWHCAPLAVVARALAFAAALAALGPGAWAQIGPQPTVTVGSIRLTVPAGWKATAAADGSTQIVPATGRADIVVTLTAGRTPGPEGEGVHESLLELLAVRKRDARSSIVSADGTRLLITSGEFEGASKPVRGALASAHAGRDYVAILALSEGPRAWLAFEPHFRRFVATAATVPAAAVGGGAGATPGSGPPAPPAATSTMKNGTANRSEGAAMTGSTAAPRANLFGDGSGVAGVYVGVGRGFKRGATTGVEIGTVDRRLVLFSDGTSTAIVPPEGFDAVDLPRYKAKYPDSFHRWEQRGSRIVIQVGARTDTYRLDGQTLIAEGDASAGPWVKVSTGTGRTLQGSYSLHHWKPADFADPKYFPYGMMRLGFAADGTFEDVAHVKTLYMAPVRLPYPGSAFFERLATPSKGRYRIANNTLYLTYVDGRELALAFWVAPGTGAGPSPSVIVVAGYALTLRP